MADYIKYLRKIMPTSYKFFQKIKEGILANSFYEASINVPQNQTQTLQNMKTIEKYSS